jgi:hypothetical protein
MYKIIGADQKQYGPVSREQLLQWMGEGRVNSQTLVCADGSTDWKPLSAYPELAPGISAAAAAPAMPAPMHVPAAGSFSASEIQASLPLDYDLDIGGCISSAWELVKNNLATIVGATAIALFLEAGLQTVLRLLLNAVNPQFPPSIRSTVIIAVVVGVISTPIKGPMNAGIYFFFIRAIRGQRYDIGNIFDGFRYNLGQNILAYIVMALLMLAAVLPGLALAAVPLIDVFRTSSFSISPGGALLALGGLLLVAIASFYLGTCWFFTLPLIMDKGLGFWQAMSVSRAQVGKHFWTVLGLIIVAGLLNIIGFMVCCVGLLVSMPVMFAALMYGYETLFGKTAVAVAPKSQGP